jgi:hypothetical protein
MKRLYTGGRVKQGGVGYAGSGRECLVFWLFANIFSESQPRLAVGKSLSLRTGRVKRQSNIRLLHARTADE